MDVFSLISSITDALTAANIANSIDFDETLAQLPMVYIVPDKTAYTTDASGRHIIKYHHTIGIACYQPMVNIDLPTVQANTQAALQAVLAAINGISGFPGYTLGDSVYGKVSIGNANAYTIYTLIEPFTPGS